MDRTLMYRKMHALLEELNLRASKPHLLEGYGVEHTTDLKDEDLLHLVDRLVQMQQEKLSKDNLERRKWRSNVLTLLGRYGIFPTGESWTDVNRFLLNPRIAGKLLYEMNVQEMRELCLRLRMILKKRQDTQNETDRLSKLN